MGKSGRNLKQANKQTISFGNSNLEAKCPFFKTCKHAREYCSLFYALDACVYYSIKVMKDVSSRV